MTARELRIGVEKPTVGDHVHYVSYGTPGGEYSRECRAATVTEVSKQHGSTHGELIPHVSLCVMNPSGLFFNTDVHADFGHVAEKDTLLCAGLDFAGGTWHWPSS